MSTEIHGSGLTLDPVQTLSEAAAGIGAIGKSDMPGSGPAIPAVTQPGAAVKKPLPALADLLSKDVPVNYFGVFHMLVAFLGMTLSTLLLLFVDSTFSFPVCLGIYLAMTAYEARHGIYSPLSLSLIIVYAVMYAMMLQDSYYLPYVGLGTFAWLAVLNAFLFVIGKPLTTFYTDKHGSMFFHRLISGIWLASFTLAFLAGWLLMPSLLYLFVPFGICFLTCAFVIYLSFFDTRLVTKREKAFTLADFTFREIPYPSAQYEQYIDFYSKLISEDVHPEKYPTPESVDDLKDAIRLNDGLTAKRKVIIGAYKDGALIGTLGVALGSNEKPLPIEKVIDLSLNPMRALGRTVSIGRFGILKDYRHRSEIIKGLFKGVFEYAIENDASFVIAEVLGASGMTYAKLGFEQLIPRSDPHFKNLQTEETGSFQILFNNLSNAMFFAGKETVNESLNLFTDINDLLTERWVKRQVVRHAFSSAENRPWMHTVSSIRMQLGLALGRRA